MPSSGSGTGTPSVIGAVQSTDYSKYLTYAVTLARYAEIIQYGQCAFFGVSNPDDPDYACRDIWNKSERDQIAFYLLEAQREIENVIGYPLTPTWITGEKREYKPVILAKNSHLIEPGVKAEEVLSSDASVNHAADPAVVLLPTTLTSTDGIKVLYPENPNVEIFPSDIYISSGILTIEIPRCRLVKYSLRNNPETGLLYDDLSNFQDEVVIKRFYTDASTQAVLVWPHGCNQDCSARGCDRYTENACEIITDHEVGILETYPATYSSGSWTRKTRICCGGAPRSVELNYKAGLESVPDIAETAIVRLAHSKMPETPCGCDITTYMWRRDTKVPDVLTRERLECPFGLSNGAWMAWVFASSIAVVRMGIFA